jgi:hypothetical protein
METPFAVLTEIARALEKLGIVYVVVGSFASSMRGLYRATGDVDILADVRLEHVKPLVAALEDTFYIDERTVHMAVTQHRSFNAIHFESVFKIDIFIPPESDFSRQQFARRQLERLSPDVPQEIYVATAEDTILAKLKWYRAGDEVSDTQWGDVLGIVGMQGSNLDIAYLREHAGKLNVQDLLEKALSETT